MQVDIGQDIRVRIPSATPIGLASAVIKVLACDDPGRSGVRVLIAAGHTDMRRGMQSLARQVQEGLHRDPHCGDLYVFRCRSGALVRVLWHGGIGMSERGRFV